MRLELSGGERHALRRVAELLEELAARELDIPAPFIAARRRMMVRDCYLLRRLATRAGRDRQPAK